MQVIMCCAKPRNLNMYLFELVYIYVLNYLCVYLFSYLFTYLLASYLLIYLFIYVLLAGLLSHMQMLTHMNVRACTYLLVYLFAHLLTYVLTYLFYNFVSYLFICLLMRKLKCAPVAYDWQVPRVVPFFETHCLLTYLTPCLLRPTYLLTYLLICLLTYLLIEAPASVC